MFQIKTTFVSLIFLLLFQQLCCVNIKFTNIVCTVLDPSFVKIERCRLKPVSRYNNYMTLKGVFYQLPITDFNVRLQFMKRANGWKPWLYDFSLKCNFTKSLNTLSRLIWNVVKGVSNIQQDCPYNQQTVEIKRIDSFYVANVFKMLPIPAGEYALFTTWQFYNVTRATVNYYASIT